MKGSCVCWIGLNAPHPAQTLECGCYGNAHNLDPWDPAWCLRHFTGHAAADMPPTAPRYRCSVCPRTIVLWSEPLHPEHCT